MTLSGSQNPRPGAAARAYNDRTKYRFSTGADGTLDVVAFFSPHAAGKDYLFVAVFGVKRIPSEAERDAATRFLDGDRA